MHCLERYRRNQVREANRKLRVIVESPDESAVHDFRVCIKRLTAFYGFLGQVDEKLSAKKILQPYRGIFKSLGRIRDAHIAIGLIGSLEPSPDTETGKLTGLLRAGIRREHRSFRGLVDQGRPVSIRLPTIRATGVPTAAIARHKPVYLDLLLSQILSAQKRTTVDGWHRKRILLKRYRHILEAFSLCPGQAANLRLLKHIALLEQLLGDWHDRVVAAELLRSLPVPAADSAAVIRQLNSQHRLLLGTARIYLPGLAGRVAED